MKILNIHGYKGSAENTACMVLKKLGHEVISPHIDYDAKTPSQIRRDLKNIFNENKPDYIVGTSLGGFFALLLSQEFKAPTVLVSTCLCPFITLPELDYKGDIRIFMELFGKISDNFQNISAVVGGKDEVINYHGFTENLMEECYIVPEGKHSGATLDLDYWFKKLINNKEL
ncbi:MAG: hypothetical protein HDT23_03265 [Ruminococcus sp.]|nr:hypothetical protein [Ruminococcus sp.]